MGLRMWSVYIKSELGPVLPLPPPTHTEKEENKFGTFSIFGPAAEVRVMQVLRSIEVMQQGWA